MSLKDINNNQELVNAYKNFRTIYSAYIALPEKQKGEMDSLRDTLLKAIENLESNENYKEVASAEEKQELQDVKNSLA